jgi:hypothetical protein
VAQAGSLRYVIFIVRGVPSHMADSYENEWGGEGMGEWENVQTLFSRELPNNEPP